MKVYALDEIELKKLKKMADRLCGGSDKMRDEGNLLHVILHHAVEIEIPEGLR